MSQIVEVKFTVEELDALHTSAISMWMQLSRDKHVDERTVEMWYQIQNKMLMAKVRQIKE